MLEPGMIITTNHSSGRTYRILEIERGCTCPTYLDEINLWDEAPAQPPHVHVVMQDVKKGSKAYLNHWNEHTLRSLDKSYCGLKSELDYDYIIVLERPARRQLRQLSMFEISP